MFGRSVLFVFLFVGTRGVCAPAAQRAQTFAELKSLRITTPLLHVVMGEPSAYVYAWTSSDGKVWTEVFHSDAWLGKALKADAEDQHRRHAYALLTGYPRFVRVGTTGYYTGPVSIDAVEMLMPDGSVRKPTSAVAVNRAANPENALVADGKCVGITHTVGTSDAERNQIDAVELTFPAGKPGEKFQLQLPKTPPVPPTFGVYVNVHGDGDPHDVPLGYVYQTAAKDLAFYDFSIPQSNNPALFAEVRKLNPKHRFILRLFYGRGEVLDYFYDEAFRKQLVESVVKQFSPNTDDLYGVALSEEELQHALAGWYSDQPQPWALKYRDKFEHETAKRFEWHSSDLANWLAEKCIFLYNDLYDQIKRVAPRLKVMPFLYVPGDISGWGWIDPGKLKKDGWVYQWFDPPSERSLMVPCVHPDPQVKEVCVRERWFNIAIEKLRAAGVPNDDIYVQIWSYLPGQDPVAQTENVRKSGVRHIFNFYYAAWIPPAPVKVPNPRDLCMKLDPAAPVPEVTTYIALGPGQAQSFKSPSAEVKQVEVATRGDSVTGTFVATLEADDGGRPSGKVLATVEFPPRAETGFASLPFSTAVEAEQTYWLCLKPKDDKSRGLLLGINDKDSRPDGQLIPFEVHGDYFRGWRTYDGDALRFEGRSAWRVSYDERRTWERYIAGVRKPKG